MNQNCEIDRDGAPALAPAELDRDAALAGLCDGRWAVRLECLRGLDRSDDATLLEQFVPLTRDPRRAVRQYATYAVGRARPEPFEQAVPLLIERALEDPSPKVRRLALQLLAYVHTHPDLCGFFESLLDTERDPKLHRCAGIGWWLCREAGR